jgi:NIMA (never in mitosis gene a)-related kinase
MGCDGTKTIRPKLISDEEEYYQKIKLIGKGAFGEVYLIMSTLTYIKYVVKIVKIKNCTNENMKNAHREAIILMKCNHPNIILLKDVFRQRLGVEVTLNIITEYCEGGDLGQKALEQKKMGSHFEETQLIYWLMQICFALKYLHEEKKIVHRDIKPSNIFLTKDGYVKLGDFGLSKIFDNTKEYIDTLKNNYISETNNDNINKNPNLIRLKSLKGTPAFFAREMLDYNKADGPEYTEKVDIWALGITFYYLMYFTYPYAGKDLSELFQRIRENKREPNAKNLNANVKYDPKFVDLIEKMLSGKEERPSAEEILKSDIIQKYMYPFLKDNNFDNEETVNNLIKEYEKQNKEKNDKKEELINKQKEMKEKELLSDTIIEENEIENSLKEEDIRKKEQMEKEQKEKAAYEKNKLMSIVNKNSKSKNSL